MIATALMHANDGQPWLVAAYTVIVGVISAISAAAMNRKTPYGKTRLQTL